jgi:hypothetical protein
MFIWRCTVFNSRSLRAMDPFLHAEPGIIP